MDRLWVIDKRQNEHSNLCEKRLAILMTMFFSQLVAWLVNRYCSGRAKVQDQCCHLSTRGWKGEKLLGATSNSTRAGVLGWLLMQFLDHYQRFLALDLT